eukprot:20563_3
MFKNQRLKLKGKGVNVKYKQFRRSFLIEYGPSRCESSRHQSVESTGLGATQHNNKPEEKCLLPKTFEIRTLSHSLTNMESGSVRRLNVHLCENPTRETGILDLISRLEPVLLGNLLSFISWLGAATPAVRAVQNCVQSQTVTEQR